MLARRWAPKIFLDFGTRSLMNLSPRSVSQHSNPDGSGGGVSGM